MTSQNLNNIRLGTFLIGGLTILIFLFYMIGKNKNLFGKNYTLRARFENIQGLKAGNNVRYAGIDVGTVEQVEIINDHSIEVVMTINKKMNHIIRKNALASIGTDGIVGNKIVNMNPQNSNSPYAEENDLLPTRMPIDTDELLRTLSKSNNNIAEISEGLKTTISKINNSHAMWNILNDETLKRNLNVSVENISDATVNIKAASKSIQHIALKVQKGEGSLGRLIYDSNLVISLDSAISSIHHAGNQVNHLSQEVRQDLSTFNENLASGKGTIPVLLNDSNVAIKVNQTLENIEKSADNFNQNMEAIKHSFLFRGYFRRKANKVQ
jgi:phospholipid/cholesterol/gamma-HCH transport system substrate-binding protein